MATRYSLLATRSCKGQSYLILVLLIGGIVVFVAITLVFLVNSFLSGSTSFRFANRAEAVAKSGIDDALLRLARDYANAPSSYSLVVGSDVATVSVTKDTPVANEITVSSTASVTSGFNGRRTLQAIVLKDATTGQVTILSLTFQ